MEPLLVMIVLARLELGLVVLPDGGACVPVDNVAKLIELRGVSSRCVDLGDAGKPLGASFRLDRRTMELHIAPVRGNTFPITARLAREAKWRLIGMRGAGVNFPLTQAPYSGLGSGGVQIQQSSTLGDNREPTMNVFGAGEAIWGTLTGSATVVGRTLATLRSTWDHRHGSGRLTLGDVSAPYEPSVGRSPLGRGAVLTYGPTGRAARAWEQTVEGFAPGHGYTAELLLRGQLADFQRLETDYYFFKVPTTAGRNDIRVRLYSATGEVIERNHSVHVGAAALPPGKVRLAASVVQPRTALVGPDVSQAQRRTDAFASVFLGITDNITIGTSYVTSDAPSRQTSYATGTVAVALPFGSTGMAYTTKTSAGNRGASLRTSATLGRLQLEHTENDKLGSRALPVSLVRRSRASSSASLGQLWTTARVTRSQHRASTTNAVAARASYRVRGPVRGTTRLTHTRGSSAASRTQVAQAMTWRRRHTAVTVAASSQVEPEPVLTGVSLSLRSRAGERVSYSGALAWSAAGPRGSLGLTLDRPHGRVGMNVELSETQAFLRLTYSYGARGAHRVRSGGVNKGTLAAHVFLDMDESGTYTPGDRPLADVKVRGFKNTDARGYTTKVVSAHSEQVVFVKEGDLIDPRHFSPRGGRVVVYPGGYAEIEVPVKYRSLTTQRNSTRW